MTRRALLATLIGVPIMGTNVPTLGTGFVVTGKADATEGEKLEGYVNLGKEFCLVCHPKSPAYPKLMELVGHDVTVTVEPA
jgi:nitrate/TMAO reductase-like tetraheme cytochrome c subunit